MGIANVIMDNLIAQSKSRPMIVVMPNAYAKEIASLDLGGPRTGPPPGVGGTVHDHVANEKAIVDDLVPFVDKHFRTVANRENRALAGLSMGSAITFNVGVKRLDVFASLALLSSGSLRDPATALETLNQVNPDFLADPAATVKKLGLLFFSCGTEDPRMDGTEKVAEELNNRGIPAILKKYSGEHEWKVWRHSLADMALLLFR